MLVSSNLPYFIQLKCVLGLDYCELYLMKENMFDDFLIGNGKWIIHVT